MQIITTVGPANATEAVLPFIAAKGAASRGEPVDLFLMQEATYLGSENHADLEELNAPGLPSVAAVLGSDPVEEHLRELLVCEPCAAAREIAEDDLREGFEFGGAPDIARQAENNETTTTF